MQQEINSSGIGFHGFLFLIFLTLKLCHVINWSWWWVTAPLWIPCIVAFIIIGICGIYVLCTKK